MRDILQVLLVAALVLIAGAFAYRAVFGGAAVEPLSVQRVDGEVRHHRGDQVQAASAGLSLGGADRLVTGPGGRVVLGLGDQTRLVLHEASSLRVLGQSEDGLEVELEGGRVQATVRPGSGDLAVLAGGREVRARDASFAVGLGEDGTAVVEAGVGALDLRGFAELTRLSEGERLTAAPGAPPVRAPIPEQLLLTVAWPDEVRTRSDHVTVQGTTHPGARVRAEAAGEGQWVVADADGRFTLTLPLSEGVNALKVHAVDPLGLAREVEWSITRDRKVPTGEWTIAPF